MGPLKQPVYVAKPNVGEDEIKAVVEVLRSGNLVEGAVTKKFEQKFAKFIGVNNAILCTNGTTALHLALEALDLPPATRILTTAFTFVASSNSILFIGGIPEFVDIEEQTFCIDPNLIESAVVKPEVRAIMPVHIFGLPANMKEILHLARDHDLKVIEDCAQAHGGLIDGRSVGSYGDIGCFSFYATKNMMSGEGGIAVTNNDDLAFQCCQIRNHGRPPEGGYRHERVGYNFRASEMIAAILNVQLERLPRLLEARNRNVAILKEEVEGIPSVRFQETPDGYTHANYVCALVLQGDSGLNIDRIVDKLRSQNIFTRRVYDVPSHKQPTYQNIEQWRWARLIKYPDYNKIRLQITEQIARTHFEIPIHPGISEETMKEVARIVKTTLK